MWTFVNTHVSNSWFCFYSRFKMAFFMYSHGVAQASEHDSALSQIFVNYLYYQTLHPVVHNYNCLIAPLTFFSTRRFWLQLSLSLALWSDSFSGTILNLIYAYVYSLGSEQSGNPATSVSRALIQKLGNYFFLVYAEIVLVSVFLKSNTVFNCLLDRKHSPQQFIHTEHISKSF